MLAQLSIFLMLSLSVADSGAVMLAQRKAYDTGNCFQWKGCKGDSIGAIWMYDPDRCKGMGGKSWSNEYEECYDLPDGAQVVIIPHYQPRRAWPK